VSYLTRVVTIITPSPLFASKPARMGRSSGEIKRLVREFEASEAHQNEFWFLV
jgi:hypothetical protein